MSLDVLWGPSFRQSAIGGHGAVLEDGQALGLVEQDAVRFCGAGLQDPAKQVPNLADGLPSPEQVPGPVDSKKQLNLIPNFTKHIII